MLDCAVRTLVAASVSLVVLGCPSKSTFASDSDRRAEIGFAIAEQQGIALDRDNPAVGLGSYLVNSSSCNDCHTWPNYAPGGDPYNRKPKRIPLANYLAGGRLFALPTANFCSRNLTPAPGTDEPAGLSRADFMYVMKTGCDPQDDNFRDPQRCVLLEVMPWPNYQDMKSQDISAIYSYLKALPHAEPGKASQCAPEAKGVRGE